MTTPLYPVQVVDIYSGNVFNAQAEKDKGTKGVIIKAGQGGYFSLPMDYVNQCNNAGLPYGLYWVIDSRYDSDYHLNEIKRSLSNKNFGQLGLWWDLEKPLWTMTDAEYWKTPYAGNSLIEKVMDGFLAWCGETGGSYTSPGFANLLGWNTLVFKSSSFANKLAQQKLWCAQYNSFIAEPDLFGNWTDWVFWQYRAEPDYNYYNGTLEEFYKEFEYNPINPPPVTTTVDVVLSSRKYFNGATLTNYEASLPQGKTKYYVVELTKGTFDFFVSPQLDSRMYVPRFLPTYNLDIAINGDGFISTQIAGYAASEAKPYGTKGKEETLYISKTNEITRSYVSPLYNAISYPNRLVVDGVIPTINKARDDIRGRTAFGYNKEKTKFFLFVVDGKDFYSTSGMNFWDVAERLVALGVDYGVMFDGGGSTTLSIMDNGTPTVIGVPCGEDNVIGYEHPMRRVANVLGVRMRTEALPPTEPTEPPIPPTTGGDMTAPTLKGTANSAANIKTVDGTPSTVIANLPIGGIVYGDNNPTNSDIVGLRDPNRTDTNVWGFYRPSGEFVPLPENCKVSKTNLTVTSYTPTTPPVDNEFPDEVGLTIGTVTQQYIKKT